VVEHHYATAHQTKPGDELNLYINGQAATFKVAGIYFSPSNLYMISPEGWIENDFGYFAVPSGTLGNYINEYRLTLKNTITKDQALAAVRDFFIKNNINAVVIDTDASLANTAFQEDASALNSLADIFTVILLFISAFIFFILLSRNVERKRREIGVYRAMGFSKWSIFFYFISFSLIAVVIGTLISLPIAYGLLVAIVKYWSNTILQLPSNYLDYTLSATYVMYSAVFSILAVIIATAIPAWRASRLKPSEAMKAYRTSGAGSKFLYKSNLSVNKKLYLRDLFGHKIRSISTVIGIALVLSIGLSFVLSMQSFMTGIKDRFDKNELWNVRIHFTTPQDRSMLDDLGQLPGVTNIEPYTGQTAEIASGQKSIFIQLNEQVPNSQLTKFSFATGSADNEGLIISGDIAYRLDLKVGDSVTLTTPNKKKTLPVAGVLNEFGSSEAFQLLNITKPNGAIIKVTPDQMDNLEQSLAKTNYVKAWVRKVELQSGWLTLMQEFQGFTVAMDLVVIVLVLIIVGIFAFLATNERRWEFVTLKLIGWSNREIKWGALVENFWLAVIGALVGIPIAAQIVVLFNSTFQELMSPPPIVLTPQPIIERTILVVVITLGTVYIITSLDLRRNVVDKIRRLFGTT